jgi:hypothetical protein
VALPFINALICAGLAYSFLALKNCGRYLAVVYNTSLLGYIFLVITAGIRIGDFRLNGPTVALFIIAGLLLLIILLLLRAERAPERSVATTS